MQSSSPFRFHKFRFAYSLPILCALEIVLHPEYRLVQCARINLSFLYCVFYRRTCVRIFCARKWGSKTWHNHSRECRSGRPGSTFNPHVYEHCTTNALWWYSHSSFVPEVVSSTEAVANVLRTCGKSVTNQFDRQQFMQQMLYVGRIVGLGPFA